MASDARKEETKDATSIETGTHGHGTGAVHEGEPVTARPAAWDADEAELAAREEGRRVAAEPSDTPTIRPGVPGDEIPETGMWEADVYPPPTVQSPRYGSRYEADLEDDSLEHRHAAMITGEHQAGHRYPHSGATRDHRDRPADERKGRHEGRKSEGRSDEDKTEKVAKPDRTKAGDKSN